MAEVLVKGLDGGDVAIDRSAINELAARLDGAVLTADTVGFDEAVVIWNSLAQRRPALVACCNTIDGVQHAVRFAARHGLLTAVQGGGHNVAGNGSCEGGLLLNLSHMQSIKLNTGTMIATVGPGCLLGQLDAATMSQGFVVPSGIVSRTGIAGLTLGGGYGWLSRRYGLSIDNLVSAVVVDGNGELLEVSAEQNPDLFWGIRGGGGNFGVVVEFRFRMHPVARELLCGAIVRPLREIGNYLTFFDAFADSAPDELTVWHVIMPAPPLPFLKPQFHGQHAIISPFVYSGDPEEGLELLKPLQDSWQLLGQMAAPMPFIEWQQGFDAIYPSGDRYYWKSMHCDGLPPEANTAMLEIAGEFPNERAEIFLPHLRGAISRVGEQDSAYSNRDAKYSLTLGANWSNPADDQRMRDWTQRSWQKLKPFSRPGAYVNFMGDRDSESARSAYTDSSWLRLRKLKARHDPRNMFRFNQNIPPAI